MKLLGKRVLIEKPVRPATIGITLGEKDTQDLDKEFIKKYARMNVYDAGDECTKVKRGDQVYIGTALEHAEIIDIDDKLYMMVNEMSISIIWQLMNKLNLKDLVQDKEALKYIQSVLRDQPVTKKLAAKLSRVINLYDTIELDLELGGESILELDKPRLEAIIERDKMLSFLNNADDI